MNHSKKAERLKKEKDNIIKEFTSCSIRTYSRARIRNVLRPSARKREHIHALLSIVDVGNTEPLKYDSFDGLKHSFCFEDVEDKKSPWGPRQSDIEKIIEFGRTALDSCPKDKVILCQSEKSISRATAVAYILHSMRLGPGKEKEAFEAMLSENPGATPNKLMVKLADDCLNRQNKMITNLLEYMNEGNACESRVYLD